MRSFTRWTTLICLLLLSPNLNAQTTEITCTIESKIPVLGEDLATTGFFSGDVDGDGEIELIFGGSSNYVGIQFWENNYFSIVSYTEDSPNFEIEFQSEFYLDSPIADLHVLDLEEDGQLEIIVGQADGTVQIFNYDGSELSLKHEMQLSASPFIFELGDADNDTQKELVIVTELNEILLLNPITFETEWTIPLDAGEALKIGNVDADPEIEMVMGTGKVYQFTGTDLVEEWDNLEIDSEQFLLRDMDNDGILEVVGKRGGQFRILVYDVDLQSLKYELVVEEYDVLAIADVNDDGFLDILTGESGSESVRSFDGVTQEILWEINNTDNRMEGLLIIDIDGDAAQEIVWVAGSGSTGPDRVHVYDLATLEFEWETPYVQGLPWLAYDVADVDLDGELEIVYYQRVTVGQETFPDSYYILTALDAVTKQIEWQTGLNSNFALNGISASDLKVGDIDDDGMMEIVIGNKQLNNPAIMVIDAATQTMENIFVYEDLGGLGYISELVIIDADADGETEIAAVVSAIAQQPTKLIFINGENGTVEYESDNLGNPFPGNYLHSLHIVDVDDDGDLDAVLGSDRVIILDINSGEVWTNFFGGENAIEVANVDDDPQLEVIYHYNMFGDIGIRVLDGLTREVELEVEIASDFINTIDEIEVGDFNENGIVEYYVTYEGALYFFENPENVFKTQALSNSIGFGNQIYLTDYNGALADPILLINGTQALFEVGIDCLECLNFSAETTTQNLSCNGMNDGIAAVTPLDGTGPFSWEWSSGETDSLATNLPAGDYTVTVSTGGGCATQVNFTLTQPELIVELAGTETGCGINPSGEASTNIVVGESPYVYNWSDGATTATNEALAAGIYTLTITDGNDCELIDSVEITQAIVDVEMVLTAANCNDDNNGIATTNVLIGEGPFSYEWSNGTLEMAASNLPSGEYTVTVTDALECTTENSIVISTGTLTLETEVMNACNSSFTGTASVEVTAGTAPYTYLWSNFVINPINTILNPNTHYVTVTDANQCVVVDTVEVGSIPFQFSVESDSVSCFGDNDGAISITATDAMGPFTFDWNNGDTIQNITELTTGFYQVLVSNGTCFISLNGIVNGPEMIQLETFSGPDTSNVATPQGFATVIPSGGIAPYSYEWSNGETIQLLENIATGDYTVTVTDANDCTTMTTVTVDLVVAVFEPIQQLSATLFPNPTAEMLYFQLEKPVENDWQIFLTNALGQKIKSTNFEKINPQTIAIDLSKAESGLYFLSLFDKNQQNLGNWRFVVE